VPFDLLIRGARVVPGDGPAARLDVGVADGRIAAVEPDLSAAEAAEVVHGDGLLLCPGFIDAHVHAALESFRDPTLAPLLAQGVTTAIIHPDGLAPAPVTAGGRAARQQYLRALEGPGPDPWPWTTLAEHLAALAETRPSISLVPSIGHSAVRDTVMGSEARPPDSRQLAAMRREVRAGLDAGARSLSFGLVYVPGCYAATDELIALSTEAARVGAPLVPHTRNEADGVLEAIGEMIEVARRSGAPLHLSHLKVIGNPELIDPLLALIDKARTSLDVTFDQYPYFAGSTTMASLLPAWAQVGGAEATLARLHDADARGRIARDVASGLPGWENIFRICGPERIWVAQAAAPRDDTAGRTLAELSEELRTDPLTVALDLMRDAALDVTMIDGYADEEAVRHILVHPAMVLGSDGIFGTRPHPRVYGATARVVGRYALREGVLPLEEMVARVTSRTAARFGLADRGRIATGLRADLVLLDPARYVDTATYDDPCRHPDGVELVVVGGRPAWRDGAATDARAGQVVTEPLPPLAEEAP
jgi:N-acyl-D-amino-acid deacylase